jgi:predicted glycosyltransferase
MNRVTILVTHLLGTGHLSRAITLARACQSGGFATQLISGGMPVPYFDTSGLDVLQIPPVRADGAVFSTLLDRGGNRASEVLLAERIRLIIDALQERKPDVFITELFPFGRRSLLAEFEAALQAAKNLTPPALVLCSIRDILEPQAKPIKAIETRERLLRFYDAVLVHSDPNFVPLEASWPVAEDVAAMLRYTGYMAPVTVGGGASGEDGKDEILVTAGGGPVGCRLFEMAIRASGESGKRRWRLLVGGNDAVELCRHLNDTTNGAPAFAEPARRDYRDMLTRCTAAVGQCGYNTAIDWLQIGVPGVFVPFADEKEVEQTQRAHLLSRHYGYGLIAESDLTPKNLAAAVEAAIDHGRILAEDADLDGGVGTVRILEQMLQARCSNSNLPPS